MSTAPTTPGGGLPMKEIALPDIECDNRTLQMLQHLNPARSYAPGNFYYLCTDIPLSAGVPWSAAGRRSST